MAGGGDPETSHTSSRRSYMATSFCDGGLAWIFSLPSTCVDAASFTAALFDVSMCSNVLFYTLLFAMRNTQRFAIFTETVARLTAGDQLFIVTTRRISFLMKSIRKFIQIASIKLIKTVKKKNNKSIASAK